MKQVVAIPNPNASRCAHGSVPPARTVGYMVGVRDQYFISIRAEGVRANKNRLCSKAGLPLEVVFCISYRYVVVVVAKRT